MKRYLLSLSLMAFTAICFAQNVGIGTNTPAAKLDVKSASSYVLQLNGTAPMYSGLFENDVYRGYFGSYAGAAEDVDFGTGAGNTTGKLHLTIQTVPKLTVDAMGNVGIGTTTPEYSLHARTTSGEASAGIQAAGTASQALLNLSIDNRIDGNALLLLKYRGSVAGTFAGIPRANLSVIAADAGAGGLLISTNQASPIYFATNVTERMRIADNGSVGIGVKNPTGILEVDAGPASETSFRLKNAADIGIRQWFMMGNDLSSALVIARFGTFFGGTLLGQANQNLSAIYTNDLGVNALAIGNKNAIPLVFGTNNLERMRITGAGRVGINIVDPGYLLQVEGDNNTAIYARTRSSSTDTSAVRGVLDNTSTAFSRASGVRGVSTSTTQWSIGVYGTHNGGGWGVAGSVKEAGAAGWGAGVYGEAGLGGTNTGTGGYGVYGLNFNTGGTAGFFLDASGTGKALATSGNVQFSGLGAASGRVLTSDASGNATWQDAGAHNHFGQTWEGSAANGLLVRNSQTGGKGIVGVSQAATGTNIGVEGSVGSNSGIGVWGSIEGFNPVTNLYFEAGVAGNANTKIGVYGQSTTGNAGLFKTTGAATKATLLVESGGNTALELNNGFMKVSGSNKTAFTVTATAGNSSAHILTLAYANPAPTDILLVTHNYNPGGVGGAYHDYNVGVYWNGSAWTIYNENTTIPILGKSFNVLVIKQ